MEIIKVTEDRMNRVLPKNILESDVLSNHAKKVLATIVNYIFVQQKAKSEGYLVISNVGLAESVDMTNYYTKNALQELIDCNLIDRKAGKAWQKGKTKMASEYWVNWKALNEPIKKMGFEELFEQFSKETKSLEKPISPTISISNSIPISNSMSTPMPVPTPNSMSTPVPTPNSMSTPMPVDVPLPHAHKKHNINKTSSNIIQHNLSTSTALDYKTIEEEIKKDELKNDSIKKQFEAWARKINEQRMRGELD